MSVDLNEKIIECLKQLSVKELPDFKITSEWYLVLILKMAMFNFY